MKELKRYIRRFFRKITRRQFMYKALIIICGLAMVITAVLPYIF